MTGGVPPAPCSEIVGAAGLLVHGDRGTDHRVDRLAGLDQLLGDVLRLVDRDREAEADGARLAGAEPPLPVDWIAELMPMTAPRASSSGPPELPGLIEASVCRALMYELLPPEPSPEATGRFFALMMPVVTVLDRPNGAPIAIVESPTATLSELPRASGVEARRRVLELE